MLQSVTQTHLVEVAGQVVEVGEILEALFLLLAQGNQADEPRHSCRPSGRPELDGARVNQPLELAPAGAQAELPSGFLAAGRVVGGGPAAARPRLRDGWGLAVLGGWRPR